MELWLCVVGGNDDDERLLLDSDNLTEIEQTVSNNNDEVECNMDKYFLIDPYTFNSYKEFKEDILWRIQREN